MLGNNEKIDGIDLPALFAKMVSALPWRTLNAYISNNAQLLKRCTIGGQRIKPEQRARLEKQIINDAADTDYSEVTCNAIFAVWYPAQTGIHEDLENYFKSDEYKQLREEQKLTEEDYVLPQEKFNQFFKVQDIKAWLILLVFSPLKFTKEQAAAILDNKAGNTELVEQIAALKAELTEANKKLSANATDLASLRNQQQRDADELQEIKKNFRQQKADVDSANQKLLSSQAENKRLNDLLSSLSTDADKRARDAEETASRQMLRLQNELNQLKNDVNLWQNRYQEQLLANRQITEKAEAVNRKSDEIENARMATESKLAKSTKFVDLLLSQIDWSKIGSQLKLSPTIKRNFNAMIKRLNYEDDLSIRLEDTLETFWKSMTDRESELIGKITASSTQEVANGDMQSFWDGVNQQFTQIQGDLEARTFMLGFIHELLFSIYSPEQFASSLLPSPTTAAAKKKASAAKTEE